MRASTSSLSVTAAFAVFGAVPLLIACSVYDKSLLAGSAGPGGSAGAGGQSVVDCAGGDCWWSSTNEDGCATSGVPPADGHPPPSETAGPDVPPFYTGIDQLFIGTSLLDGTRSDDAWQSFGFDLDGTCTNSATCANSPFDVVSCQPPLASTGAPAAIAFDGETCRDNTFARLQPVAAAVPDIGIRFGLSEEAINCQLWSGNFNNITKVSGYNGEANDDQVRVDYYRSAGVTAPSGWDCLDGNGVLLTDFRETFPRWLTSSAWFVGDADLTGPIVEPGQLPDSIFADPNAYVRDGYLVVRFPDGTPFHLPGDNAPYPGFKIILNQVVWVAKPERAQDGTWRMLDGLVSGRMMPEDLKQSFRDIGFCGGPLWDGTVNFIDENSDVLVDGANDPSRTCDSMSVGLAFTTAQITPGPAVTLETPPPCDPTLGFGGMGGGGGAGGSM